MRNFRCAFWANFFASQVSAFDFYDFSHYEISIFQIIEIVLEYIQKSLKYLGLVKEKLENKTSKAREYILFKHLPTDSK